MQPPNLTHDDIESLAATYANIIRPDNPTRRGDPYPVTTNEINYGYKQASSTYYASCGPDTGLTSEVILFKADKECFNNCTPARVMAILTHELTHVTVGSHTDREAGAHPPRFWREFGFNAHIILENWEPAVEPFDSEVSKRDFIGRIVADEVTHSNIDRRYASVMERRQEMASWFKNTLKNAEENRIKAR